MSLSATIEKLAVKHEAFGFGKVDAKGFTTHGFDPEGLEAFVKELLVLEREACAQICEWTPSQWGEGPRFAAEIRARNGGSSSC